MLVSDPSRRQFAHEPKDYFVSRFHGMAHAFIAASLPRDQLTVSTALPLAGSEPLVGIRSMSCANFTAFTLQFETVGPISADITKYSNGCTGVTALHKAGPVSVGLHAKSAGFDENASGRLEVDYRHSDSVSSQVRMDFPNLDTQRPGNVSLGSSLRVSKNVFFISQVARDAVVGGLKFQPCAHVHAGLGIEQQFSKVPATVIHSSMYLETHNGSVFGFMGALGKGGTSSFKAAASTKLVSWFGPQKEGDSKVSPVVGIQFDKQEVASYMHLALSASNGTKSKMNLGLKLGVRAGIKSLLTEAPQFSLHVSAAEERAC